MTQQPKLEVWYDGDCPICRRSRSWSERRDDEARLDFRDFRSTADDELPAPREVHRSTMMVRTPSGRLLQGFAAWRRILAALPGWRWLSRLAGVPPLRWIGSALYRLVARYRHRLSMPLPAEPRRDG
jgi:predicted DCC family thiol-disulfide oxidoreductase YuxK